jgi:spore germination cell wall hydrolase CwlJ-like protein
MYYTRLVIVILSIIVHFDIMFIVDDNRVYAGGELAEISVCATLILPDSLKPAQKLMAKLIYAEAGNESLLGKRAVADVIMNRAHHHDLTVAQIVYQDGEFDGIHSDGFNINPYKQYDDPSINKSIADCMLSAKYALMGKHVIPRGVLFYHNPRTSTDRGWISYIEQFMYRDIDNHRFCYHPKFFS